MEIKPNPKLMEVIESTFNSLHEQQKALTYACMVAFDTVSILYEWGWTEEDEHKYRLAFMLRDVDVDSLETKYKLRYPLIATEEVDDLWDGFYKWLVKNPKLSAYRGRFSQTPESKQVFQELQLIKNFDLNRFKASVESYYIREGQYAKALPKFLTENARGEYEGFREVKQSGML